jgi:hypothetical protein
MIRRIIGLFSGGPYYLRVNRERIAIRDISSGKSFQIRAVGKLGSNRN